MTQSKDPDQHSSLAVLMFTDIVDSVGLKTRIGATRYGAAVARHDALFQGIVASIAGAKILKDQGDGFMARFQTASSAVEAALRFQLAMSREPAEPERCLVRIGIHMGEVADLGPDASGENKIVGLAIDLASRIESLALPRQILLTRAAFDDARQFIREHPTDDSGDLPELQWKAHGPYQIKGLDEPIGIFEVGAKGIAPLEPPPDSTKATRSVATGEETLYDWRPAAGQEIPGQSGWILEEKLGTGGFGEVWLGVQKQTRHKRAFKFCFDAERLLSLKKELAFFQVLLGNLGERDDIARLFDVRLDSPPYFLVSEYSASGDLEAWFEKQGGAKKVPLETRIDLVARSARAVAAAHSVGVLHKDLKPANILVSIRDGLPRPKIADFGISALTEKGVQAAEQLTGIAAVGRTELKSTKSTGTGSQMYSPPELMQGVEFTPQGDVYALGVVLYQLVVGDLKRPLGHGWEKDVRDPLLREDIAGCVSGDLAHRFNSPNELAERLENLQSRRQGRWLRRGAVTAVAAVLLFSVVGHIYSVSRHYQLEQEMNQQLQQSNIELSGIQRVWHETMRAADPQHSGEEQATVDTILDAVTGMLDQGRLSDVPLAEAEARLRLGRTFHGLGRLRDAEQQIIVARDIRARHGGDDSAVLVAETNHHLARLHRSRGDREASEALFREVLAKREDGLGANHPDTALTRYELSVTLRGLNELEESKENLLRALEIAEAWLEQQQPADAAAEEQYREIDIEIARMYNSKARMLHRLGKLDEAEKAARESLNRRRELLGAEHRDVTRSLMSLVWLENDRDNVLEAERLQRELLEIRKGLLGNEHREVASAKYWLARLLLRRGRYGEAARHLEQALEIRRGLLDHDSPAVVRTRVLLGRARQGQGRFDEALVELEAAFSVASEEYSTDGRRYHDIAGPLGEALCRTERCEDGMPLVLAAEEFNRNEEHTAPWRLREARGWVDRCHEHCGNAVAEERSSP